MAMSGIRNTFRDHSPFIAVVSALLVVMTWPTIVYVFDTETFWLPTDSRDVWMNIWDARHGQSVFAGEASPYFTYMQFHPVGLPLEFNPNNMIQRALLWMLGSVLGTSNAFSLIYLLIVFVTAASAYVYIHYLFKNRWLALFGAVVFGFSQHVVGHANHPMVNLLATIPLSLYALQRGIEERKLKWMLLSGALVGITAFIGLYILVCLLITLGLFILCFTSHVWRQPRFWIGMVLLFGLAGSISLIHVYPVIRNSAGLDEALEKNRGQEFGKDLLSFFVNGGHPWLTPAFVSIFNLDPRDDMDFPDIPGIRRRHKTSYLGYIPLLLIALGLCSPASRRKMYPWLLLLFPFLILRLGSRLHINGEQIGSFWLPKHYLNDIFPWMFRAVYEVDHFQIGVLLPLAVLSCFGLQVFLKSVSKKRWSFVVLGFIALVAFEYYQTPLSMVVSEQELAFNTWLKQEENQEGIHLVNLPMGRRSSKLYGFFQTINGYPHAEGLANRTPEKSYDYIDQNLILRTWRKHAKIECRSDNYLVATDQLLSDGFTHVILHKREPDLELEADSFTGISPAYLDDYVSIYHVRELRATCLDRIKSYRSQFPHLDDFSRSRQNDPRLRITLLNLYPVAQDDMDARYYFTDIFDDWRELIHLAYDGKGIATVDSLRSGYSDLSDIITENNIFWLIYDPAQTDLTTNTAYKEWLLGRFKACERIYQSDGSTVEAYIDRRYPCELVLADDSSGIRYQNGIRLKNWVTEIDGGGLSMYSLWSHAHIMGYAYSIQVFDENAEKQSQIDQVIDSRPLSHRQIDIGSLEAGDYVAKLIVYETDSGRSQSGAVLSTGQPVEREFEIARFSVAE